MDILRSDIIQLNGVANSMQGGRPENQDDMAFLDTPLGFLALICDGMGGGPGGKTASYIVKYEIASTLRECNLQTPIDYALKMAVSRANDALERKMREVPSLQGMGSTFVAVLINKDSAYIVHAGDSRCYVFRQGKCVYRSQDHSLVGELVRRKALTEEEARLSPQSNVITRGLGSTTNHIPDIEEFHFKKGDRFVLCTDGVWGIMPHDELIKRFAQKDIIKHIVSNLSSEIDNIGFSHGGHHDNHTIAVFEIDLSSRLKANVNWKKIAVIIGIISCILGIAACIYVLVSKDNSSNAVSSANNSASGYPGMIGTSASSPSDTLDGQAINKNDTIITANASNKDKKKPSKASSTTIQKIIEKYRSALRVEGTTSKDAQTKLSGLRNEIKSLMNDLRNQCEGNATALSIVEEINKTVDDKTSWYADKVIDKKTGKYKATHKVQSVINSQIEKLEKLRKNI